MAKTTVTETTRYTYEGFGPNRFLVKKVKTTVTETDPDYVRFVPNGIYVGDVPNRYDPLINRIPPVTSDGAVLTKAVNNGGDA